MRSRALDTVLQCCQVEPFYVLYLGLGLFSIRLKSLGRGFFFRVNSFVRCHPRCFKGHTGPARLICANTTEDLFVIAVSYPKYSPACR